MTLVYWLYVSRIDIAPIDRPEQIQSILSSSRRNNQRLGITGCLFVTKTHFAQWLEGPAESLGRMQAIITSDHRHADATTVGAGPISRRQFDAWSLGYVGPAPQVARVVLKSVRDTEPAHPRAVWRLLKVMRDMTGERAPVQPPEFGVQGPTPSPSSPPDAARRQAGGGPAPRPFHKPRA